MQTLSCKIDFYLYENVNTVEPRLIWTPVNADNGHLFFTPAINEFSPRANLAKTDTSFQLCAVIGKIKKKQPSVDSMSMLPALPYTGRAVDVNFWHGTTYAEKGFD